MSENTALAVTGPSLEEAPLFDCTALRHAGRSPALPFRVRLADGQTLCVQRLLRVLPGKRLVGEALLADGRKVLAKLFVARGSRRHWRKEQRGIAALAGAGLPTPALVAAQALPGGGHALLTAYLEQAVSLAADWDVVRFLPPGDARAVSVLAPALRLLGRMHACGLVQNDLHLGNFLRCAEVVFVIDGDAVRALAPGRALTRRQALRNLAILLAQLPLAWDAHWLPLLKAYAGTSGVFPDLAALQAQVRRVRCWRLEDVLRKSVRECSLFSVRRCWTRFVAAKRAATGLLAAVLEDPDRAMRQGVLLKDGGSCTVVRLALAGGDVVIKRYNLKGFWHALSRLFRPSRAWHSWHAALRLAFLDIPTPEPLALIEERWGPLRRRAWLVSDYCPGIRLSRHLAADAEPAAAEAQALIGVFSRLGEARLSHGDLKASNLLWHDGQVVIIDLDAVRRHGLRCAWQRAWQRDRARLLRNWPPASVLHRWLEGHLP